MIVNINGYIGLDTTVDAVRKALKRAGGADIDLQISSPGGMVSEGIAIHNAIKDYAGKVTARIVGMAASMASYIPLAADETIAEDNAIYMIHNPLMLAIGDYRDMGKAASMLDSMAKLLGRGYAKKTGKDMPVIRAMMDDETYLFGAEIVEAGLADSVTPAGDGAESKAEAMGVARANVLTMNQKTRAEGKEEDLAAVALMIPREEGKQEEKTMIKEEQKASGASVKVENATQAEGEKEDMTAEKMRKDYPGIYAEIHEEGAKAERGRVDSLMAYINADPDNTAVRDAAYDAIKQGTSITAAAPKLAVAIRDFRKLDGANPPGVTTEAGQKPPTEEDQKAEELAGKIFGMSPEEFKKNDKGGR